ncbi:ankyrin repeats protein [Rhizoctonia solani]|uniref:Ankyrin repeats protein n=1 Tax=Rhizoctonia solani TaxID=456999 RepID=A0A8H7IE10_9AGAM|nr:ankyrin repeats protein [Rhizoctonia solani]
MNLPQSTKPLSSKDERVLNALGIELLAASAQANVPHVVALLKGHAPAWFQDQTTGWGVLHFALPLVPLGIPVRLLRRSGSDLMIRRSGRTWKLSWRCGNITQRSRMLRLIRDAGLRSEFALHVIQAKTSLTALRAEDYTAAGSTEEFLKSKLTYRKDENGQEIVLLDIDGEEVGVMMGWEKPIMEATVRALCPPQANTSDKGPTILNVGFGLGIIDTLFQSIEPPPSRHVIIEPHPDVLAHMRSTGWFDKPGVEIFQGKWQDFTRPDRIGELIGDQGGFDVIYTDTFSEGYSDLYEFFEHLGDLISGQDSRFSFFNGLGATQATFYDVYTKLSALHLEDMALTTTFEDIDIHAAAEGSGAWARHESTFHYHSTGCLFVGHYTDDCML